MRVVCYYTNWSVYRPGAAKFNPQNINPYLCTHLIYAFGGFTKENTLKPFDKYQDIEKGGYAKFTGLKTYNKNLKTMLAIGGWNEGSTRFSPMVANAERRKELVRNAIKFLRQNHFDGLDLDWEYPSFRDGGKPRDKDNYAQLVQELREEFDRESEKTGRTRLLLTMAVPAGIEYINKGYDVPKLTKYLDWMNILSYDYHSAFEPAVNHHAPLFSLEEDNEYNYDAELNIDYTIKHYLKLGADPNKLVLGIPTYGRSYTLYNPDAFEIGSPADGPGDMGEATRENGYLAYYEICDYVKNQGWEVEQPDTTAMGPYAFKDNQWVGYDDESIVKRKSEYVAENDLGGIMFWAIDNDDFRGNCQGKPYPLIEAAKEALINAYGLTDENLISPPSKPTKLRPRTRSRPKTSSKVKTDDDEDTKIVKPTSSSASRRRNRIKSKAKEEDKITVSSRRKTRRKDTRKTTTTESTTHSSLKLVTPSYTTPAPPSTPDLDGAFKCEDEGFFPHPKDCKKYFWCLGGAGDTGIIAHQFTCPAGLYFNKAADSCDYSQNVLCNKKLSKPTTTTTPVTSSSSTTSAPISTSRAPPKITAATSKTTFKVSTTTEPYEEEYEYDDDEEVDEEDDSKISNKNDSEEDPKVIKELIDLIKKAGGIEELEKQLKFNKNGVTVSGPDSTTQSILTKSLYERVLSKAVKNTLASKKNTLNFNRNSRGPQNDGLTHDNERTSTRGKTDKGKLQYTSISRNRPISKSDDEDEKEEEKDEVSEDKNKSRRIFNKKSQPEYVTIRRPRVSSTTEALDSDRNRILGEVSEEDDDDDIEDDDDDEDDDDVEEDTAPKKTFAPQYVNIRRQRPSTTEETSTSKYTVIRRGSTTEKASDSNDELDDTTLKYKTIRRGSTTSAPTEETSSKYQTIRRGTTTQAPRTSTEISDETTSKYKNFRRGSTTEKPLQEAIDVTSKNPLTRSSTIPSEEENDVTARYPVFKRGSTTVRGGIDEITTVPTNQIDTSSKSSSAPEATSFLPSSTEADKITTIVNLIDDIITPQQPSTTNKDAVSISTEIYSETTKSKVEDSKTTEEKTSVTTTEVVETETQQQKRPQLSDPRPFSISRGSSTSTKPISETTTQTTKVSQSNFKFRLRPKAELNKNLDVKKDVPSESSTKKAITNYRTRGSSRFSANNPEKNINVDDIRDEENSIKPTTDKIRKRYSTTEKYVDENRTFRPSGLDDLSSLTAVDFSKIKEVNLGRAGNRRRIRPSTTQVPEEYLKVEPSIAKGRRISQNANINDQVKSASTIQRIRGLGSRTTRQPSTTESIEKTSTSSPETVNITPRTRRVIRRYRPTTAKAESNKEKDLPVKIPSNFFKNRLSHINRNKNETIISSTEPTTTTTEISKEESQNPLQNLFNKSPARLPFGVQQNDVEEESDEDSSTEEGENIKLSESNIRENSDVNSFDTSSKHRRKLVKLIPKKSDTLHEKVNVEVKNLPIEKTSESSDDGKVEVTTEVNTEVPSTENVTDITVNVTTEQQKASTTTAPNVIVRTRKIIRKIKPTAASITKENSSESDDSLGRKRKIIRRLRPVSELNKLGNKDKEVVSDKKPIFKPFRRGKPTLPQVESTSQTSTTEKQDIPKRSFKPLLGRSRNRFLKSTTPSTNINVKEEATTQKNLEAKSSIRPRFRPFGRFTTTTAKSTEDQTTIKNIKNEEETIQITTVSAVENNEEAKLNQENNEDIPTTTEADEPEVTSTIKPQRVHKPFIRRTTTTTQKTTEVIENTSTEIPKEESGRKRLFRPKLYQSRKNILKTRQNIEKASKEIPENVEGATEQITVTALPTIVTDKFTTTNDIPSETVTVPTLDEDTYKNIGETTIAEEIHTSKIDVKDEDNKQTDEKENDRLDMDGSSTTTYNLYVTPPTAVKEDSTENEDEDRSTEDKDENGDGDKGLNYTTIIRASTRTNTFDVFDSESDTPPFEKDAKFGENHEDEDEDEDDEDDSFGDDDFYSDDEDDDKLIDELDLDDNLESSSTSNEFINEGSFGETSAETTSTRSFYNPDEEPSFSRSGEIEDDDDETDEDSPKLPKYKTFSRTTSSEMSLSKETIKIHTFNNTDPNDKDTGVNKVLFTNRYKYKSIERTTSSPLSENSNATVVNNSEDINKENVTTENAILNLNTIDKANSEENNETKTEYREIATEDVSLTSQSTDNTSIGVTISDVVLESDATTEQNIIDKENEIFDTATTNGNISTESTEFTTSTESQKSETVTENSVDDKLESSTIATEQNILSSTPYDSTITTERDIVTSDIPETTAPIESNQTSSETTTVHVTETTTPYQRRSTLRSIDARPKFVPSRLKNRLANRLTTESSFKQNGRFNRNRYQKSTTESVIAEISPSSSSVLENIGSTSTTTPLPVTNSVYQFSSSLIPFLTTFGEVEEKEKISTTIEGNTETNINVSSTSALPIPNFIYDHSTTTDKSNDTVESDGKVEDKVEDNIKPLDSSLKTSVSGRPLFGRFPTLRTTHKPSFNKNKKIAQSNSPELSEKSTTVRTVNKPKFLSKSTESPKLSEDLSGIDTEAVKNRNKNLFSKKRKMNTPFAGHAENHGDEITTLQSSLEGITTVTQALNEISQTPVITTSPVSEPVTKPSIVETTEYLTTLHHIFSQLNENVTSVNTEATTEALNSVVNPTTGKIERLVEVNRIVQVKTKEAKVRNHVVGEQKTDEVIPTIDKIGEVSRVTVIKVVDGNNTNVTTVQEQNEVKQIPISPVYVPEVTTTTKDTQSADVNINGAFIELPAKVEEVPAPNMLGKINLTNITVTIGNNIPELIQSNREERKFEINGNTNSLVFDGKAEIIDGKSHINVVTPKPVFSTEVSTIALEGLFQSVTPVDELLEADHSRFVNVRVLHQDGNAKYTKDERDERRFLPIRLLEQDEEARVVEVTEKSEKDMIRIVPIKVAMSRKITDNFPILVG